MSNQFGHIFTLTSFGESHGKAIGGIIDGCPSNIVLNLEDIQNELDLRKPGQSQITTSRKEEDIVQFLSGIKDGKTLGTPIGFTIQNKDHISKDYDHLKDIYRPSHADFTYQAKYGIRDHRGGGRQSARETACRVVAGAIAKQILAQKNIQIIGYTSQIKDLHYTPSNISFSRKEVYSSIVRCPDNKIAQKMISLIEQTKQEGDSIGGTVTCVIKGVPTGLGEPIFHKLQASLAYAMLGINAVKGFDYGLGFNGLHLKGSEYNDAFNIENNNVTTLTNHSGGIQGGISNGSDIVFRVVFKPTATISMPQNTVDSKGNKVTLEASGRHDPCVVPRAVPIVEAMAAMVILDHLLMSQTNKIGA